MLDCDFVPVEQNLRTETRGMLAGDSVRPLGSICLILFKSTNIQNTANPEQNTANPKTFCVGINILTKLSIQRMWGE